MQRDSLEQAATRLPTLTAVVAADKKVKGMIVHVTTLVTFSKLVPAVSPVYSG